MRTLKTLLTLAVLAAACGDDKKSGGSKIHYTGAIPRFSVDQPANSGLAGSAQSMRQAFSGILLPRVFAQQSTEENSIPASQEAIDCTDELNAWNAAPQLFERAATIPAQELARNFYAQAIFYDCNARQQLREDGAVVGNQANGNDADAYTTVTARLVGTDFTRFVSWISDNERFNKNVKGKMVNLYPEEGEYSSTKTRIDLSMGGNGARTIKTLLKANDNANNRIFYVKANFKEVLDGSGRATHHYITGRYFDNTARSAGNVVTVRAVLKKDTGLVVQLRRCPGSTFNAACNAAPTGVAFNPGGSTAITTPTGLPQTDAAISAADTTFLAWSEVNNFWSGTEDDFFDPTFSESSPITWD